MDTKEIIALVAKEKNMTPGAVEKEMQDAIRQAMASKDPHAQALWKQLAPDGKEPTIEEFLAFCNARVNKYMGR